MTQSRVASRLNPAALVAALLFALVCASALVAFSPGKALAVEISTTDDFVEWCTEQRAGAILKADITITDADIDRIPEDRRSLTESLNGYDHTITLNLTRHPGLFTQITSQVYDLRLAGSVNCPDAVAVGALASELAAPGNLEWVSNFADVTGSRVVGGIVGRLVDDEPYVYKDLVDTEYDYELKKEIEYYCFKRRSTCLMTGCLNYGTITGHGTGTNPSNVGGIAGEFKVTGGKTYTAENTETATLYSSAYIERCYNAGTVIGYKKNTAGIIAEVLPANTASVAFGSASADKCEASIRYCYNVGTIDGGTKDAAGIVAHATNFTSIKNCYNAGWISADNMKTVHGIIHWDQIDGGDLSNNYSVDLDNLGWASGRQNGTVVSAYDLQKDSDILASLGGKFNASIAGENKGYPVIKGVGEGQSSTISFLLVDRMGDPEPFTEIRAPYGQELKLPTPPELRGLTFQYWTTDAPSRDGYDRDYYYEILPEPYTHEGPYTGGVGTLYAYYAPNPVTLNFDVTLPNGEKVDMTPPSTTVYYSDPYGDLPRPQVPGRYRFLRWYNDVDLGIDPTTIVSIPGGSQTVTPLWDDETNNIYFTTQPADVTIKENEEPVFHVMVHDFDGTVYEPYELYYQWYVCYDPEDPTTYKEVQFENNPTFQSDPISAKDGNIYYFCDVFKDYGKKFLLRSRMAHVTVDMGQYIEAQVDSNGVTVVPGSERETASGDKTYEYDVPVTVSLSNVQKLKDSFDGVRFTISLPEVSGTRTFTHEESDVDFDKGTFTYLERVRFHPNQSLTAQVNTAFISNKLMDGHESVFMPKVSASFWIPEITTMPTALTQPQLYAGGGFSNIWDPGLAELSDEIHVGDQVTAIAEVTWGADFTPTNDNFDVQWQYNAGDAEWATIEGVQTQAASDPQDDGTTHTRITGTFTAGLEHNGARVRAVVGMNDKDTSSEPLRKTSENSELIHVAITAPTNVQLDASNNQQIVVRWNWDEATQGIPHGVGDKGDFVITYAYTGLYGKVTWDEVKTVVAHYDPSKKTQAASIDNPMPGTDYTVAVQAVANRELGKKSDPPATVTTPGTPLDVPDISPHGIALGYGETMPFSVVFTPSSERYDADTFVFETSYDGETWTVDDDPTHIDPGNERTYLFTYTENGPSYIRCLVSGPEMGPLYTPAAHVVRAFNIPTNLESVPQTYSAELSWQGDPDVQSYMVRWTDANNKPAEAYWNYVQVDGATSLKLEGLRPDKKHHWQVTALPIEGVAGSYDWTDLTWGGKPNDQSIFQTAKAPKAGTWTLEQDGDNPIVAARRLNLKLTSDYKAASGTTVTYDWQCCDAGSQEWKPAPYAEDSMKYSFWIDDGLEEDVYGRTYRCVVTASTSEDGKTVYTTNEVTPAVQPPAVGDVGLAPGVDTLAVSWPLIAHVDTYQITYGTVGENGDIANPATIMVGSKGSSEATESYMTYPVITGNAEVMTASYTLTNLPSDTNVRVVVEPVKLGQHGEAKSAEKKTLSPDDLPVVASEASGQYVEVGSTGDAAFTVSVVRPADGSEISGSLERYVPSEDGTSGTWEEVAKASAAATRSLEELVHLTATLAPRDGSWRFGDALKLRFSVTKTTSDGAVYTTHTEPVSLKTVSTAPTVSVVEGLATTTSVGVFIDGSIDGVASTNRFELLWTDDPVSTTDDLSGWKRMPVDADENGQATYTITSLNPGTSYRIIAVSAPLVDGEAQPVSQPSNVVEATTIKTNPLTSVEVTPARTVAPVDTPVTLAAQPVFDGDAATVAYQWQCFVAGAGWQDMDGATAATLEVTVDTSLADAYRCVVTASGEGMEDKTVESNRATVLADGRPELPTQLAADPQLHSVTLSWTGTEGFVGSYLVEYRVLGASEWLSADAGETSCVLEGLESGTTYEWRVTAEGDNGLSSLPVTGPLFSTAAGSMLKNAWMTPGESAISIDADVTSDEWKARKVTLTVTTDVDSTETLTYNWMYSDNGGTSWRTLEGVSGATYEAPLPVFASEGKPYAGERLFRCEVTAAVEDAEGRVLDTAQVASNKASVRVVPNAPSDLSASVNAKTAKVEWSASNFGVANVYEVQYRAQGTDLWITADTAVEASNDKGTYEIADLTSGAYEWRMRAVGIPVGAEEPDSTCASAWVDGAPFVVKAGSSGLTAAVVTPQMAPLDPDSTETTYFTVETDAPEAAELTYEWQYYATTTAGAWSTVDANENFESDGATLSVKPSYYQTAQANGTLFRCVVADKANTNEVPSNEALLTSQTVEAPTNLSVSDVAISNAQVSWDASTLPGGSYTLQWRAVGQPVSFASFADPAGLASRVRISDGQASFVSIDASGWNTEVVDGVSYNFENLTPGTRYEWRVQYVSASGVKSPTVDGPAFTTPVGSALQGVVVTPKVGVGEVGEEVTFTAVTNVDGDVSEGLTYQWGKAPRGSNDFTSIAGEESKTLTVPIGEDDLGTQYRCTVSGHKNDDSSTQVESIVSVWKRLVEVTKPEDLQATATSAVAASLSWTCDAQVDGTFTVEYRPSNGAWQTVSGLTENKLDLTGLEPGTVYEWRVSHVIADGMASDFVSSTFETQPGSALTSVMVTPPSVTFTGGNETALLTAAPNVEAKDEELTYQWELLYEPGRPKPDYWGNVYEDTTSETTSGKAASYEVGNLPEFDISYYRCVITATKNGHTREVTSAEVLVSRVPEAPTQLAVSDVTKNAATLTWAKPEVIGSVGAQLDIIYEVAWRAKDTSTWKTARADTESYQVTGLAPSTTYEWQVRTEIKAGGTFPSAWSEMATFTTLGPMLTTVEVTPTSVVGEPGETAELTATTNVDGDSEETLVYRWQTAQPGSDEWTDVPGANAATLTVTIGADDKGVLYRCVVTATKDGLSVERTSNEAAVWARANVPEPDPGETPGTTPGETPGTTPGTTPGGTPDGATQQQGSGTAPKALAPTGDSLPVGALAGLAGAALATCALALKRRRS